MKRNQATLGKILVFAAVVEGVTGIVLLIDPGIVTQFLLGTEPSGVGVPLGRCFGIALLALGLACWPGRRHPESASGAWRAMLAYNLLIALFLTYLATAQSMRGLLLWPAVAAHAAVALLLLWLGMPTAPAEAPRHEAAGRVATRR